MKKQYNKIEFKYIKLEESNCKYFVASVTPQPTSVGGSISSMNSVNTSW